MIDSSVISEVIVLAGGLGTRLKSTVPDLPKSLAPVGGKPFLDYLLGYCRKQGIQRYIFALGYKTEMIESFIQQTLNPGEYVFSIEKEPLGTGGAIQQACRQVKGSHVIVLNADTFFGLDLHEFSTFHLGKNADCSLALKQMNNFDRYGVVERNDKMQVTGFSEKKYMDAGLINGGVYALRAEHFLTRSFPPVFSFEKDYLERDYRQGNIYGMVSSAYFIDIGIPEDYHRAQTELVQYIF